MRRALSKGGLLQRVHIVNMPPYAPDYNPMNMWNTAKDKLSNVQQKTFEETKQNFMRLTNSQIFPLRNMTFCFAVTIPCFIV